jgi:hypothetical protein
MIIRFRHACQHSCFFSIKEKKARRPGIVWKSPPEKAPAVPQGFPRAVDEFPFFHASIAPQNSHFSTPLPNPANPPQSGQMRATATARPGLPVSAARREFKNFINPY